MRSSRTTRVTFFLGLTLSLLFFLCARGSGSRNAAYEEKGVSELVERYIFRRYIQGSYIVCAREGGTNLARGCALLVSPIRIFPSPVHTYPHGHESFWCWPSGCCKETRVWFLIHDEPDCITAGGFKIRYRNKMGEKEPQLLSEKKKHKIEVKWWAWEKRSTRGSGKRWKNIVQKIIFTSYSMFCFFYFFFYTKINYNLILLCYNVSMWGKKVVNVGNTTKYIGDFKAPKNKVSGVRSHDQTLFLSATRIEGKIEIPMLS